LIFIAMVERYQKRCKTSALFLTMP